MNIEIDEKIEALIDDILKLSDGDRGILFDRMSSAKFVENDWFEKYAGEFWEELQPLEPDSCIGCSLYRGDADSEISNAIEEYGIENVVIAVKKYTRENLTSDFPRKYSKNGIPQF